MYGRGRVAGYGAKRGAMLAVRSVVGPPEAFVVEQAVARALKRGVEFCAACEFGSGEEFIAADRLVLFNADCRVDVNKETREVCREDNGGE